MIDFKPHLMPMGIVRTLFALGVFPNGIPSEGFLPAKFVAFADTYVISKKALIVGLNPSNESPTTFAFDKRTKSGKTVREWLKEEPNLVVDFTNLYSWRNKDAPKPRLNELPLSPEISGKYGRGYKIVACGEEVHKYLTKYNIQHFYMPHPSGLNRFWNNKVAGEAKIKEMIAWIKK